MSRIARHVRHNVIAYVALFIALGGSSYAAVALKKNSVGTAQLKKDSVTSAKVKDGSLLAKDFSSSQLAGLKGATGATGATGAAGAKGDTGPSTGPAGGDLAGTYPNPTIGAGKVTPSKISGVPTVRVYATASQATTSGINAAVIFNAEDYDASNMHDPATPTILTAPIAGTYAISGAITFANNVTGVRSLAISVPSPSGTPVIVPNLGAVETYIQDSTQVRLAAGDNVQFNAFQNSGGALNIQPFNTPPSTTIHAEMTWIAP